MAPESSSASRSRRIGLQLRRLADVSALPDETRTFPAATTFPLTTSTCRAVPRTVMAPFDAITRPFSE